MTPRFVVASSQALAAALDSLRDERFWHAQPPHFGTQAAARLTASAQALLGERFQGLALSSGGAPPAWSGDRLQERLQGLIQVQLYFVFSIWVAVSCFASVSFACKGVCTFISNLMQFQACPLRKTVGGG